MRSPSISIIIPFYNERESIPELIRQLDRLKISKWHVVEYIFIDDGSSDGSFELLRKTKTKRKRIIIRFRKNLGKSAALAVGFSKSRGDYIVTMDADLQDEPTAIPRLLAQLDQGSDMVIGWRKDRKDLWDKRIQSRLFNAIVGGMYHVNLHDMNSGLKACTQAVAHEISLYGELHRFMPVLAAARGFRVTEVPVPHHSRRYGVSKYNGRRIVHAFFDLASTLFLTTFEHEPMQIFGTTGVIGFLAGLYILIYLSVLHFQGQTIGRRPLLFMGILLVLFGMQMVSVGLLGELIVHKRHDARNYPIAEITS